MDIIEKEMLSRKSEIKKELRIVFDTNMKITDWDIPEADDRSAAKLLLEILREGLEEISADIESGKYDNY
jgi:hypothetical protein